jgi:DegV family protein with EDD domain
MSNIKIFTDSTSDLSQELIEQYDISIIPLYVNFGEKSYKDGVEITAEELFKKVDEYNRLPMTSAPSPSDFHDAFKPFIDQGKDILYIGLSSKLSSTIQNANIAAGEFPENRLSIIDSLNVSLGIGLLVLKAADYARKGMTLKEISSIIQEKVSKLRVFFIIDTLEYLQKGGRCSSLQSLVGGILKIKPVIKMEDGKVILWEKLRGKREKGLAELISKVLKDKDKIDLERIVLAHSMCFGDAVYIKTELKAKLNANQILIGNTGCVISSHCGPKTVGIIYMIK